MSWAIETYKLSKQFPKSGGWRGLFRKDFDPPAVDSVSITVNHGELFGLVGPNGAGKTTLIKLLSTLILPSSGTAAINGYDLHHERQIKQTTGLVTSDERSFFWRLTGKQNLVFFAALDQIRGDEINQRVMDVMDLMGLQEVIDKPFQTYSTGMRQRLSIARALLSKPGLLFLDEPTKGLDPKSSHHLRDILHNRLSCVEGVTIFMASHNLEEVENFCDRVAIMHEGRIIACGTMEDLAKKVSCQESYEIQVQGYPSIVAVEKAVGWVPGLEVEVQDKGIHQLRFHALSEDDFLAKVFAALQKESGKIIEVNRKKPSLDSIFSEVTTQSSGFVTQGEVTKKQSFKQRSGIQPQLKGQPIGEFLKVVPAFLRRDLQMEMSYRLAFALQLVQILFSIAVFYFIAQLIGPAANPYLQAYGGDYFSFVLIGVAFSGYFGVGLSSFSNSLRQAQTTGTLEAMLSTPTSFSTIIISSTIWSYLMTSLQVVVYLLIGALFLDVDLKMGNLGAALIILILTVISFSSLGILAASFIMVLKRGNPVTWVFGTISSLLGGIYYPIDVMPAWLQFFSHLLPVTYALRGMRLALLQGASFVTLAKDILVLSLFCIILLPLGLFAFRFAVNKARADGSLTHY